MITDWFITDCLMILPISPVCQSGRERLPVHVDHRLLPHVGPHHALRPGLVHEVLQRALEPFLRRLAGAENEVVWHLWNCVQYLVNNSYFTSTFHASGSSVCTPNTCTHTSTDTHLSDVGRALDGDLGVLAEPVDVLEVVVLEHALPHRVVLLPLLLSRRLFLVVLWPTNSL